MSQIKPIFQNSLNCFLRMKNNFSKKYNIICKIKMRQNSLITSYKENHSASLFLQLHARICILLAQAALWTKVQSLFLFEQEHLVHTRQLLRSAKTFPPSHFFYCLCAFKKKCLNSYILLIVSEQIVLMYAMMYSQSCFVRNGVIGNKAQIPRVAKE